MADTNTDLCNFEVEASASIPRTFNPIQVVDHWTERRVRIRPTRIVVRGWQPARAGELERWYVSVQGNLIRLSDQVETRTRRTLMFAFTRGRVSDRLVDDYLEPELRAYAYAMRDEIRSGLGWGR